ncbi:M23 family metallopeptidase [Spirosoma gilvum]
MQLRNKIRVGLLVLLFMSKRVSVAQTGEVRQTNADTLQLNLTATAWSDSLQRVLDSLEVTMLKTSQTYQQIHRLLSTLPARSMYLDSLPAVLPIEVSIEQFRISSPFGIRQHPIHKQLRFHAGIDVKSAAGMIVKATAPGVVSQVGFDPRLGEFIRVQHAFGFETTYGHLSGYCVQPGQIVVRSEQIGKVGSTGLATGPHLHYVIKKNGSVIDPFEFCFLLRRRLWLQSVIKEAASGNSVSDPGRSLSSKGSYPNSRN